jgi:hypothetical protein
MTITITLTVEQLLLMPGDAVTRIVDQAQPPREFVEACLDHENRPLHGKGRWPVNNTLRQYLKSL